MKALVTGGTRLVDRADAVEPIRLGSEVHVVTRELGAASAKLAAWTLRNERRRKRSGGDPNVVALRRA